MSSGQWHGGSDSCTSPRAFFYHTKGSSKDIHPVQFKAVWEELQKLLKTNDGNAWPVIQLIFTRFEGELPVIAFRFTSDHAYYQYDRKLITLGSSLGRGSFKPFSGDNYNFWFKKENKENTNACNNSSNKR